MNMRKIVAVMAAVLMLCSLIPASVFAANGDIVLDKNFNDGNAFFERGVAQDGYLVFDATTADWQNTYQYVNNIKSNTTYKVTFKAKANKEASMNFKINNNWTGDVVAEAIDVTTEWQDYELIVNVPTVESAVVMFTSGYEASSAPIYNIDDVKIVETVDPALLGKVVNGDFSSADGWNLGNGATISGGVLKLANINAWSEAAMQTVPVKANTNYEITWKSQRVNGTGAFNMILMDGAFNNLKLTAGQNWMTDTSNNWINHSVTLNTGDSEVIIFKLTTESAGNKTINIDDIKIIEVKDPVFDGFIYNGDFETGKILPWDNLWGSNKVEMVAGHDGDYAMKVVASGAWTHVRQTGIAVKPNTDYVIKLFAKDTANYSLLIKDNADSANVAQGGLNAGSEWTPITFEFNSGNNSAILFSFMSNNAGDTCTVDDITMFEKVPASNDGYIINGTFETGDASSWENVWDSNKISVIKGGEDSTWALNIISGQWKIVRQKIAVEANTNYKITVSGKDCVSMGLLVKDGADTANIAQTGFAESDSWEKATLEFNSGANTEVYICLMGNVAESVGTFDNIIVEKANACQHEYENECDKVCALCGEQSRPEADHAYVYACDPYCNLCGEKTNPRAKHNITHVDAKAAVSCVEFGNREYWTCDLCGAAWLDAAQMIQTNLKSVQIAGACISDSPACKDGVCVNCGLPCPAESEHVYDNVCDSDCNLCGETREAGHTAGAAADCENAQVCTVCGAELAPAVGHKYNSVVTKPTCTTDGFTTYICTICGDSYVGNTVAAPGHTAGVAATCTNDQVCTVCGAVMATALGHKYNDVVTDPNCVNGGYTTHTCSVCGDTYVDSNTDALGHKYNDVVTAPNCVNGGYTTHTCSVCGDTYVDSNTNALGHKYDDNCDIDCNVCGENREVPHGTIIAVEAKNASCYENGNLAHWYCESCGQAWLDADKTLNTNLLAVILPAGHTYDDYADADCNVCGEIREVYVPIVVLSNLGTSVCEDVNGLAFGFSMNVADIEVANGNEFVGGSVVPYENGHAYKLIGMGAIMSNQEGANLELKYVDNKRITDVSANLLYDVNTEDGAIEFAVRIINIPNVGKNVTISARPYFVFEREGVELVTYGDVIASSYNAALAE